MSITRPMLAAKRKPTNKELTDEEFLQEQQEFIDNLDYPTLATPKLDGIRCLKINGQIVSRTFKPIPNDYVRTILTRRLPDGIDGELMLRRRADFNEIQSAIMTIKGAPSFEFWAFDYVKDSLDKPYSERLKDLQEWYENEYPKTQIMPIDMTNDVKLILPKLIETPEQLHEYEQDIVVEQGFEGVMTRTPDGPYKCGRATLKEGYLTKVVRVFRDEGTVIGFEEKMHNENELEEDEFGLAKRSSKKDGKVGAETLGRLTLRLESGIEFGTGTGFDDAARLEIWKNKEKYLGKKVTFEYRHLSKDDVPRFPAFVGFRHENDL